MPFMGLACIIMLMHDHPFLSFNGRVQMCVCVYVLSKSNEGLEVGAAAPLSSGSPALRGNIPSYSLVWRPLERKWGRQLSDLPPPPPPFASISPQTPSKLSTSRHRPSAPSFSLCFHSVNNQAVALSVPGPNWAEYWR